MRRLQEEQNNLLQRIAYSPSQNTPPKKKKRVKRRDREQTKSTKVLNLWKKRHEEMIEPENQVAQLAFAEAARLAIEENGIELAQFSSIDNKRSFNTLVKNTRKVVEEADDETRQALKTFQHEYEAYAKARETGFRAFVAAPSCEWVPTDPPNWEPGEPVPAFQPKPAPEWTERVPPAWIPREKPEPELLPVSARPVEVSPPEPQPKMPDKVGDTKTAEGSVYWQKLKEFVTVYETVDSLVENRRTDPEMARQLVESEGEPSPETDTRIGGKWVALNPDNGWPISVDNVPSVEGTETRFPRLRRSLWGFIKKDPPEWERFRQYEQSLRDWAASVKAYKAFCENLPNWEVRTREAQAENERILKDVYPDQIKHFEQAEKKRRAEWKRALKALEEAEKVRRSEWELACITHEETERRRREAHEEACMVHAEAEKRRREEWKQSCDAHEMAERRRREAWQEQRQSEQAAEKNRRAAWTRDWRLFAEAFRARGDGIVAFLDENPDLQTLYPKVNPERDLAEIREKMEQAATDTAEGRASVPPAGEENASQSERDAVAELMRAQSEANAFQNVACPVCGQEVNVLGLLMHYDWNHGTAEVGRNDSGS